MATRATESVAFAGTVATYHAASGGGDKVAPGSTLHVVNISGGSINLTIATPGTVQGLAIADNVIAIPDGVAGKFVPIGAIYRDPADGLASLAWSAATSVTFAVIRA